MDISELKNDLKKQLHEAAENDLEYIEISLDELETIIENLSKLESLIRQFHAAVASDAWAITFQTMGQYRSALLKILNSKEA
jgi:hypothetical protein